MYVSYLQINNIKIFCLHFRVLHRHHQIYMLPAFEKSKTSDIFCILDFLPTIKLKKKGRKKEKEREEGRGKEGRKYERGKERKRRGNELVTVLLAVLFLLYIWDLLRQCEEGNYQ